MIKKFLLATVVALTSPAFSQAPNAPVIPYQDLVETVPAPAQPKEASPNQFKTVPMTPLPQVQMRSANGKYLACEVLDSDCQVLMALFAKQEAVRDKKRNAAEAACAKYGCRGPVPLGQNFN